MSHRPLSELDFVDLYICLEGGLEPHCHKRVIGRTDPPDIDIPPEFKKAVDDLTAHLIEHFSNGEMGVTFDGVRMRAAKVRTSSGSLWVALRKINAIPPVLEKLGLQNALVPHIRALGKREGLILVCGATGQGKTTTACSMLRDYLGQFGGVAFTIEDPVEYDLEGRHGKTGYCYQSEISNDAEWAEMLKRSLRWHPRYIFVGEIRTPDAANQLLRAATSGHLVLTTMHAGSIEEGLEGMLHLAEQAMGERATTVLSTGLTAVIHQSIMTNGLRTTSYITEPNTPASPFRVCIRDKRIGQTRTFIDQQQAMLNQSGKIFRESVSA